MHGSIQMQELYLYVGLCYFTAFCNRVHNFLVHKVHFSLSSAYYIDPQKSDATQQDGPHIVPYGKGDLDSKYPYYQWYRPGISNSAYQYSYSNPKPTKQVTWSYNTKSIDAIGIKPPFKPRDF